MTALPAKRSPAQRLFQAGVDRLRHPPEAQIIGVDAVHGAVLPALGPQQGIAVHEPDPLAPGRSPPAGLPDDLPALPVQSGEIRIGLGQDHHRQAGVPAEDGLQEGAVGLPQVFRGGGVVVVVVDKAAHGQTGDIVGHPQVPLGAAAEAQAAEITVQPPGHQGAVGIGGAAGAAPLGDG